MAERNAAVHAASGLLRVAPLRVREVNLVPVVDAVGDRPGRHFCGHLEESCRFTHSSPLPAPLRTASVLRLTAAPRSPARAGSPSALPSRTSAGSRSQLASSPAPYPGRCVLDVALEIRFHRRGRRRLGERLHVDQIQVAPRQWSRRLGRRGRPCGRTYPRPKLRPISPNNSTLPPVMYSQPWSPIPSTTACAPLLRTAKRSPARPRT